MHAPFLVRSDVREIEKVENENKILEVFSMIFFIAHREETYEGNGK